MPAAVFILLDEHRRRNALNAVNKAALGLQVKISKPTRHEKQNRLLHAVLTDVSEQLAWPPGSGEMHDVTWWKRRSTLGWLKENRQEVEIITDLEGDEFALLLPHTSDLSTTQCAALSEWLLAFGAHNGVTFKEPDRGPEPPDEAA
jgi:hypothetical protein